VLINEFGKVAAKQMWATLCNHFWWNCTI